MNVEDTELESGSVGLEKLSRYLSGAPGSSGNHLASGYQGSVDLYKTPLGNYVVKRARGPFFWRMLGEAALRRENAIYERLQQVDGVPKCLGLLDGKHLVLEHVSGESYRNRQHELKDRDLFFVRLLKTLKDMHAAGVAHGDLKRKDNLLVGPGEQPVLIDFGLGYLRKNPTSRTNDFYFRWIQQYDYNAWIKHKYLGAIDSIEADDLKHYQPMRLEQVARAIRVVWQKLTFRRYRTRHR
ncbi:MAG: hypothetical protein ACJ0SL_07350 [Candidatus Rariloculaceae bacterium]